MVSRRWDPGIGEVVRVGADTNHDQNRGDMIRDCGGKIGIESILGTEIFGSLRICGMVGIWIPFSIIIMTKWRLYREPVVGQHWGDEEWRGNTQKAEALGASL
uniref:Uncharacterized protein n=1 Tax=Brassica oleracea TaxID=3712 RepID=A0A3P6GRD3_BRAOL|nr:unnamed protein product [Brassica oleracea]